MNKDFPLNRFNFTNLIEHIRTEILIPNVITDDETGIEFYGGDSIPQKALIDLLKNFNIIDNLVQQSNSEEFKKQTQIDIKNFQFEPSWVKITPDNITVGYVGIYVNADFSLTFSNINDKWVLEKYKLPIYHHRASQRTEYEKMTAQGETLNNLKGEFQC